MKMRCTNTKQVILTEPLEDDEIISLIALASALDNISCTVSESGKIILFKCDDLENVFEILSSHGLIEYIGSLKEIIDWDIVSETNSNNANIIQLNPKEGK
tara:strand:- start:91 stop:393 length:303 start_codon:yes stop_codon:yes gene_type:complete